MTATTKTAERTHWDVRRFGADEFSAGYINAYNFVELARFATRKEAVAYIHEQVAKEAA